MTAGAPVADDDRRAPDRGRGALPVRIVLTAAPLVAGAVALALPHSILVGGTCWLVVLAASLAGWGRLVARAARVDVDLGLRLAWGAAAYLAVGGWLMAAGVLTAPVQLVLIAGGVAAYIASAWRALPPDLGAAWHDLRARPALGFYLFVGVLLAIGTLGAVARVRANVYDDDVAYTAFVQRLLQVGDLDEPFSFRRISTYGGNTILTSMAAARGTLANMYLVDHGLFHLITVALVVGLWRTRAAAARALDHALFGLLLLVLALLPDTSINSTSHWEGVALFLALYRTATLPESRARWLLVGLIAGAAASLRQNHVVVAGGFVFLHLLLARGPGAGRRWLDAAAGSALALLPYMIASWRTFGTPMYPLILGNANGAISLTPMAGTWWQELQFLVRVLIEPTPIRVMLPLSLVLFAVRDRRRGRPLDALAVSCVGGFLLLVHGFTLSDPFNLWRYGFGFMTAWVIAAVLEPAVDGELRVPAFGRLLAFACLVTQLAVSGIALGRSVAHLGRDLGAAARDHAPQLEATPWATYEALQRAVPAGMPLAIVLDQPYALDYARNPITNLDTPGYVGPDGATPAFRGSEAVAAYLRAHGFRHLAFVRGTHSRYFYRRDFWMLRIFFDTELWQVMGAYMVDFSDNLDELSRTRKVLFERDGMVLLDLDAPGVVAPPPPPPPIARPAWIRALAEREHLLAAWELMSRDDVLFEDGLSLTYCVDRENTRPYGPATDCRTKTGAPLRWMGSTAHLRVRTREPRRLVLRGRINVPAMLTLPTITVSVGGETVWAGPVSESGAFDIVMTFATPRPEWTDVYLTLSSVSEPWRDPAKLWLAALESARWEPLAP